MRDAKEHEIIGAPSDDEIELSRAVTAILRHLITNVLFDLDVDYLGGPGSHERYPDEQRLRQWDLVDVFSNMLTFMAEVEDPRELSITWFNEQQQTFLCEALRKGLIPPSRIYNLVVILWEEMLETGFAPSYEPPPVRIIPGKPADEYDCAIFGSHHLGMLYSFTTHLPLDQRIHLSATAAFANRVCPSSRCVEPDIRSDIKMNTLKPDRFYPRPQNPELNDPCDRSFMITPCIIFPNLRSIMLTLTHNLMSNEYAELKHIPYRRVIDAYNGPPGITDHLLKFIDNEILLLQGKEITTARLDSVRAKQTGRGWPSDSGYLDYITDDRNESYWRPYVGQSRTPPPRLRQHVRGAADKVPTALHYFIVYKGNGSRAMNFLKLWTITESSFLLDEAPQIFANLLEKTFTRAFQSLPARILERYFGKPETGEEYCGLGLNVVSPLLQGLSLKTHIRQGYSLELEESPDPQIRAWPEFRSKTRERDETVKKWQGDQLLTTWADYRVLFEKAFEATGLSIPWEDLSATHLASQAVCLEEIRKRLSDSLYTITGERVELENCIGSPDARVGMVLSSRPPKIDPSDDLTVPWGIGESGLSEENSLILFADPRCRILTNPSTSQFFDPIIIEALRAQNGEIIRQSNLKVIILDGNDAANLTVSASVAQNKFELSLYCGTISGFFETEGTRLTRVYFQTPAPLNMLWAKIGPRMQRISEIFKFSAVITRTHGILPYWCISASALHRILQIYHEESNGAERMTAANIDPVIEAFIFRRGFRTEQDIARLEAIGGTLSRGLLLLLTVLRRKGRPYNDSQGTRHRMTRRRLPRRKSVFGGDELDEMEKLHAELNPGIQDIQIRDCAQESLGAVDEEEIKALRALVQQKEEDVLSRPTIQGEDPEVLQLKLNDIDSSAALDAVFPECGDGVEEVSVTLDDGEVSLVPKLWRHAMHSRRGNATQRPRDRDTALFEGKMYSGYWSQERSALVIRIAPEIAAINIELPAASRAELPSEVLVKAEICPGKRHPEHWALDARDGDPGAKLALSIDLSGEVHHMRVPGESAARKANTLVDWVNGEPIEIIAQRPRRHINAHDTFVTQPLNLPGKGTWFTDDEGQMMPSARNPWRDGM